MLQPDTGRRPRAPALEALLGVPGSPPRRSGRSDYAEWPEGGKLTLAVMGRDLRARRRALGLTQAGLAAAVGTRPVMVGRWERGEALPSLEEALRLAEILDLDPAVAAGWSAVARRVTGDGPAAKAGAGPSAAALPRRPGRLSAWWLRARAGVGLGGAVEENAVFPVPRPRQPGESYLDDPAEQRRYLLRGALTLLMLGLLAVGLIWALWELREGWGAFLDLFRGPRPGTGLTRALLLFLPG